MLGLIKFKTTKKQDGLIIQIAERAYLESEFAKHYPKRMDFEMDLSATHSNGTPLDFKKLLAASDFDFWHDIWGYRQASGQGD